MPNVFHGHGVVGVSHFIQLHHTFSISTDDNDAIPLFHHKDKNQKKPSAWKHRYFTSKFGELIRENEGFQATNMGILPAKLENGRLHYENRGLTHHSEKRGVTSTIGSTGSTIKHAGT